MSGIAIGRTEGGEKVHTGLAEAQGPVRTEERVKGGYQARKDG